MQVQDQAKALKGGFVAERDFAFRIQELYPALDVSDLDLNGAVLIVEIANVRRLNMHQLSRVLIGAANGGVKIAVVDFKINGLVKALPLLNLWLMVSETLDFKTQQRVEVAIRRGTNGATKKRVSTL